MALVSRLNRNYLGPDIFSSLAITLDLGKSENQPSNLVSGSFCLHKLIVNGPYYQSLVAAKRSCES